MDHVFQFHNTNVRVCVSAVWQLCEQFMFLFEAQFRIMGINAARTEESRGERQGLKKVIEYYLTCLLLGLTFDLLFTGPTFGLSLFESNFC